MALGRVIGLVSVAASALALLCCESVVASTGTKTITRSVNMNCARAGAVCTPVYSGPLIRSNGPVTAVFTIFATATARSHLRVFVDGRPAGTTPSIGPGAGSTRPTPVTFPHDGKTHKISWEEVCSCAISPGSHTRYDVTIRY